MSSYPLDITVIYSDAGRRTSPARSRGLGAGLTTARLAGCLALLAVAVVASIVPALRVRRLDPVSLLRAE